MCPWLQEQLLAKERFIRINLNLNLEPKVTDDTKILIRTFSSAKIHELEHKRVQNHILMGRAMRGELKQLL